jgi:hypothetical protein
MRITETIRPNAPSPRSFTLEVDDEELQRIADGLERNLDYLSPDMREQIEAVLQ